MTLASIYRKPLYNDSWSEWSKFRDIMRSGKDFVETYLEKYTTRETNEEFAIRKNITYNPAIARAAVLKIKNSIFQRLADVTRTGGPRSYLEAANGTCPLGVDLAGRSMNQFLGKYILPEMLSMKAVGVMVDKEVLSTEVQLLNQAVQHPYLYTFAVEDIINTVYVNNTLTKVFLRRNVETNDDQLGLIVDNDVDYLYMEKTPMGILWKRFLEGDELGEPVAQGMLLISEIPFVLFEIEQSLLTDVADYQIALLNIESGDVNYCWKGNFPFYTEQDSLQGADFAKTTGFDSATGAALSTLTDKDYRRSTRGQSGRIYGPNMDRPGFIHPSSEPLMASIKKQEAMKNAIEYLVGINLESLASSSAESKAQGQSLKEEGLSVIGLELERAERQIAEIWRQFEGESERTTIDYPNNYSLRTDSDRRAEASELIEEGQKFSSQTLQRAIAKRSARLLMTHGVSEREWAVIDHEIDTATVVFSDPKIIADHFEKGLVSRETAIEDLLGLPEGEAQKAEDDRIKTIKAAVAAQTSPKEEGNLEARIGGGEGAKKEKEMSQKADIVGEDRTRGKGKNNESNNTDR